MARKQTTTKVDPLESWHALQKVIHGMSMAELQETMEKELAGKNRRNMVMRIHMKINKLRYIQEKAELIKRTNEPNRHQV